MEKSALTSHVSPPLSLTAKVFAWILLILAAVASVVLLIAVLRGVLWVCLQVAHYLGWLLS